jgi:hypothetical protein
MGAVNRPKFFALRDAGGAHMRIIPTRIHGVLDYVMGIVLIASPWVFDFSDGGVKTWLPVVLGAGTILYSLFTDYELGVVGAIPMPVHLVIDLVAGILLAASPWLFGFSDEVKYPHLILGLLEIGAVVLSQHRPRREYDVDRPSSSGNPQMA